MHERLQTINSLLSRHDVKAAEALIAETMKAALDQEDTATLRIYRARVHLLNGHPTDAINELKIFEETSLVERKEVATIELLADSYFARFEMAHVGFADRDDAARARNLYEEIIDRFPDHENLGWIYYQRGRVHLTDNEAKKAIKCFESGLLAPSHVPALSAYCYERLGFVAFYERRDLVQANSYLNRAIYTYPESENRAWFVHVHLLRSRVLREMHRFPEALNSAEAAISIVVQPSDDLSKRNLAEALLTAGELLSKLDGREQDVITYLQRFLQIGQKPAGVDVTWSRVHEMLGDALFASRQYRAAISAYQEALAFNPYHPWEVLVRYRIARCLYELQAYDEVIQAFDLLLRAAQADNESLLDYQAYDMLGGAYFALKRYYEAAVAYQTALELAPTNADDLEKIRKYFRFSQELNQSL